MGSWNYVRATEPPHKKQCECGWCNSPSITENGKKYKRCKCCGKLIDDKERFKEEMRVKLKGGVAYQQSSN